MSDKYEYEGHIYEDPLMAIWHHCRLNCSNCRGCRLYDPKGVKCTVEYFKEHGQEVLDLIGVKVLSETAAKVKLFCKGEHSDFYCPVCPLRKWHFEHGEKTCLEFVDDPEFLKFAEDVFDERGREKEKKEREEALKWLLT